jgi:coenzyme F420-reducing hydrogenase delta subunit
MTASLNIVILACRQAVPDPEVLAGPLRAVGLKTRVIAEPCSSKVEAFQMLRLLAGEADLVWVAGCPEAACRLVEGSFRMSKRTGYAQDYLREIGLEPERLGWSQITVSDVQAAAPLVAEIKQRAHSLGLNPARAGARTGKEQP